MPVACPSSRMTTARRGMTSGWEVRRTPVPVYPCARPCRAVVPWASCLAPRACGAPNTRPSGSRAGTARSRPPRTPRGSSGVAPQGCLWRRGPVWWWSHGRRVSAGAVLLRWPALPLARRRCLFQTSGARLALPAGAGGGWEAGGSWDAPLGSLPRPPTVPGPASSGGCLPRAQSRANASPHAANASVSPTCAGSGGLSQRVGAEMAPRRSRV